jgi:hypothetical protein
MDGQRLLRDEIAVPRQHQGPQEVGEIVGQRMKLLPDHVALHRLTLKWTRNLGRGTDRG